MTPPTVNAYYNPTFNEIVFPAGILQPPFYDPHADDAINYGGMGAVIGHEISHGFDDQGSQFDGKGNLKNWWTEADRKNFDQHADCIVKQFDSYEVEPGLHQNGKLVLGESIGDLGGLTIAYAAYEKSIEANRPKDIDGFTPEQRFFLGWAQVWGSNMRPEFARLQTNTNPHPLPRFRANGPVSNFAAFAKAFGCEKGQPMVRSESCKIW
jgi:putative endopeptidase